MPLITVKAGANVPPGTYPATLIGITPKRLVTKYSKNGEEQDFLEWNWSIEGIEVNSLTTTATGPKSRIFEYLVALLGADKVKVDAGFEESDLVGKVVLASIINDEDGWARIDRIIARTKDAPKVQTAAPVAAPVATPEAASTAADDAAMDDLPF